MRGKGNEMASEVWNVLRPEQGHILEAEGEEDFCYHGGRSQPGIS